MLKELLASQVEGKAIPFRTELTDLGGPLLIDSTIGGRSKTPLSQREASRHMQAYGGTDSIDWLMSCVRLVAETASNAEYHFEDNGEKMVTQRNKDTDPKAKDVPPLLATLIDEPNPFMCWAELCELTLIDYLLVGNAYWVKWQMNGAGQPLALYRMAPQHVKIIPGQFGPEKYAYLLPGQREPVEFTPDQIVHFKTANPHNPYYGLGIVQGGARALDMELALTDTMASYYEKQALPSGVVSTDRRVPKDVFNKLKTQLRSFYGGSRNSGQLMVLEAGLKYQTISPTAADALFVEGSRWSRDRVFSMFRVNKAMLGIDDGDAAGSKIGDAQRIFDTKTMRPLLNKFQKSITRGLTESGWGIKFVIDYEQQISAEDRLKLASGIAALPGIKVKEIREVAGFEPSTGDPELDDLVLNLPSDNGGTGAPGDPTRNGNPDRNLPGEPGRPPNPENTLAFTPAAIKAGGTSARQPNRSGKAMTELDPGDKLQGMIDRVTALAHARAHEGKAAPVLEAQGQTSTFTPPDDTNLVRRDSEVDAIAADLKKDLQEAAHTLERGLLDSAEGKASSTIYQKIKASQAWATFRTTVAAAMDAAAQRGLSVSTIHAGLLGHSGDEIDYEAIAKQIIYREGGVVEITKTLQDSIAKKVLATQKSGGGRVEIESTIKEAIDAWKTGQAETIALTEAVHSYNEGTIQVAEANGMHLAVHEEPDAPDEACVKANGQKWTPSYARAHRLEHPRCRRGFTPVPA